MTDRTDVLPAPEEATGTRASKWFDPLQIATYRRQLSDDGYATLRRALVLHVAAGVCEGLSLLALLPLATVLAQGGAMWGLGLSGWVIVLAALAATTFVLRYFEEMAGFASALDFTRVSHAALGNHLSRLPLGWFTAQRTGTLSRLVSDGFMGAAGVLAHFVGTVVLNAVSLLVLLVGSWFWDFRLGLVCTILTPVAVAMIAVSQRVKRAGFSMLRTSEDELANRVVEYAACQPALRAAGRADAFEPLERASHENHHARVKDLWWSVAGILLNGMVVQLFVVVLITLAANLALDGSMGPIETIAFVGLVLRFTRTLGELAEQALGLESGRVPLSEIRTILDAEVLPEPATSSTLSEPGAVEFADVSFGYDPGTPVLQDLSFRAEPRTMTALVGPSGSGKTTIARLISRFWEVDTGSLSVGGADVRDQSTQDLMAQLSMVFQDVYLFDDTLAANVRVGRPDASAEEVERVAALAGVSHVAERLPEGWETYVGEGGRSLSGGERQRVSIARALLKRAPIVLFDEATSALDGENEANVLASMEALKQHSTLIVIAHKLDTIQQADNIVVLDAQGRVAEAGTHEELYQNEGDYRRFWDRRAAATGWTLV